MDEGYGRRVCRLSFFYVYLTWGPVTWGWPWSRPTIHTHYRDTEKISGQTTWTVWAMDRSSTQQFWRFFCKRPNQRRGQCILFSVALLLSPLATLAVFGSYRVRVGLAYPYDWRCFEVSWERKMKMSVGLLVLTPRWYKPNNTLCLLDTSQLYYFRRIQ